MNHEPSAKLFHAKDAKIKHTKIAEKRTWRFCSLWPLKNGVRKT